MPGSDSGSRPQRARRTWTWVGVGFGAVVTIAAAVYALIGTVMMLPLILMGTSADAGDYLRFYAPALIAGAGTLSLAVRAEWTSSHDLVRTFAVLLAVLSACALGTAILYVIFVLSVDGPTFSVLWRPVLGIA